MTYAVVYEDEGVIFGVICWGGRVVPLLGEDQTIKKKKTGRGREWNEII